MSDFNAKIEKGLGIFKTYLDRTKMDHKDYQYDGVKWCLKNELRPDPPCNVRGGFIADEMGLGKTILMIGTFLANFLPHTLVVVPPVLIDQWYHQIYKTTGYKPLIYHGAAKKNITSEDLERAHIVITSYGGITLSKKILKKHSKDLSQSLPKDSLMHEINWSRIVFDEAHHLRNKKTVLYNSVSLLKAKIRWLVSGTPVQNAKSDFYNLCAAIKLPANFYSEKSNLKILARSFILRRSKKQVGIIIPDVFHDKNQVDWANHKEKDISEEIHSGLNFSGISGCKRTKLLNLFASTYVPMALPLVLMLKARQTCIFPKMMISSMEKFVKMGLIKNLDEYKEAFDHSSKLDYVVNSILERKGNGSGKIIFCHFREEIDEIAKRLIKGGITKVAVLDGRTKNHDRYDILHEKNEALILQIQTGCEGLNLQENYNEIYFISPHWNPAVEDQAIARCHRIGQTKPVYVRRFQMGNFINEESLVDPICIDSRINNVQDAKRDIAKEYFD